METKLTFEDVDFICEIISKNSNDDFDDLFIDEENVENQVYDYFQDQIRYTDYEKVLKGYKENKLPKQILKELYK